MRSTQLKPHPGSRFVLREGGSKTSRRRPEGFALIVVVTLMVLLSLLAVGLLGLSAVALRSSTEGTARAEARANARLALTMAIGELQKAAGPDRRITARADILGEDVVHPHLTGVWDSRSIDPTEPPGAEDDEESAKAEGFRGWLVSRGDPSAHGDIDFARRMMEDPVKLMARSTLGDQVSDRGIVRGERVRLGTSAEPAGGVAWAVLDEGVKARVNTGFDEEAAGVGERLAQLGSGVRPGTEFLPGLGGFEREYFERNSAQFADVRKGVTWQSYLLAGEAMAPGGREALRQLTHDVTTHSLGVFADVARGGLKWDFHSFTEGATLPDGFAGRGVYASMFGVDRKFAPSDPRWESFREYANLYREGVTESGGAPQIRTRWPSRWTAMQAGGGGRTRIMSDPPEGVVLMPSLAKVQMVFSLIARDLYAYPPPAGRPVPDDAPVIHLPQGGHYQGTDVDYDLHLLYTPVVTLHNPYNVALEFNQLRVEFSNVPFAATVYRNGRPQNTGLAPLERMWIDNEDGQQSKTFGLNLKTKTGSGTPGSADFVLLPGETKLFSPYIDPNRTYREDLNDRKFWDIYVGDGLTDDIDAIPGWRGDGIGFDLDWWNPPPVRLPGGRPEDGRWEGTIGLRRNDRIHIEFAPLSEPKVSDNKFTIELTATLRGSSRQTTTGAIEIDYGTPEGLQEFLIGSNGRLRYPKQGAVRAVEMLDHSTTPIKDIKRVKPFALMTVQGKTTSGGRDSSQEDGRHATKPWSFAHAVAGASPQNIREVHPANHSHEIDLQGLDGTTANLIQLDLSDRANFITGHTAFNGIKFGSLYEIPLNPIQSLDTLNGANPGGASGYLPRFAQPIGNSWAHPMLPPDALSFPGNEGNLVDHSFLLNLAFYDRFYFSGLAGRTGPFGDGRSAEDLAGAFAAGDPLDDPRLIFHRPQGRNAEDFTDVVSSEAAHREVAAWQLIEGPFNVNSTSVAAWTAMLGSIHDPRSLVNRIGGRGVSKLAEQGPAGIDEARTSRFRLPVEVSTPGSNGSGTNYWLGAREWSDDELETLAENIVRQVRLRGPFLSMAEFVNRRFGSGEFAQRGALQQAIDDSDLNLSPAAEANAGFEISSDDVAEYNHANPDAATGASYQGAPGFLTQADVLKVLGNAATVRSDSFTIRAYGESLDPAGRVRSAAWCEATVQRLPEWVDAEDKARAPLADLSRDVNRSFGRRFQLVSFRWLNPDEV